MNGSFLPFQSACRLLQLLSNKEISSRELLDLYLARIETYNPIYNAVVSLDIQNARNSADAIDNGRARGEQAGPLSGLPMTIKDSFEVVGMPTTCGLPPLVNHRAQRDADAVERLRKAGAIVFGKTNVPAGLCDWQTVNPVYGLTRNPWDPERTAGGSSGGTAAALAAGLTALDLGSDFAGSNRVPAHFCGVFGHRPSYGIVPFRGHIPPMPGNLWPPEMAVAGPLARSAADLRIALEVLNGPSSLSPTAWKLNLPPSRHQRFKDFRVALWAGEEPYTVDENYWRAIKAFVGDLKPLVGQLSEVAPPFDVSRDYDLYLNTVFAIVGTNWPIGEDDGKSASVSSAARDFALRSSRYAATSFSDWSSLQNRREQLFIAFHNFFLNYDVLLCPAAMTVAFRHDTDRVQLLRTLSINGQPQSYLDNFAWPSIAACANLPAIVMPTGHFVEGLPAGVQIIGPNLEDHTVIRFAELVEAELGGFIPPPTLLN